MPELSTDVISLLGLLVLVLVLASPRTFPGLSDSAPETEPARLDDGPRPDAGKAAEGAPSHDTAAQPSSGP